MARKKRKVPPLNGSSMADISFLLLIYFLLTSSMDTDSGLPRRLPEPVQEKTSTEIERRNMLIVLVSSRNETLVRSLQGDEWYLDEDELMGVGKVSLKDKVKEFVLNTNNSIELPEVFVEDFGAPIGSVPTTGKSHVVSLQNDATTSYKIYITVQNELVRAYNELRQDGAKKYFNVSYDELTEDQKEQINKLYPQRISEAEPKNYGER